MSTDHTASTTLYRVSGMTCQHCVDAVTAEVAALPGVSAVRVDLDRGELVVTTPAEVTRADVAAAVDEAGYTLV